MCNGELMALLVAATSVSLMLGHLPVVAQQKSSYVKLF